MQLIFPYASSSLNAAFSYIILPYIHPRLNFRIGPIFPDCLTSMSTIINVWSIMIKVGFVAEQRPKLISVHVIDKLGVFHAVKTSIFNMCLNL